jgi:SAM-dependent methyltransferase
MKKYKPENHESNRMKHEGDTSRARKLFYQKKSNNLYFLLKHRFTWMNDFIPQNSVGIEVGAGTGVSEEFINSNNFKTTDYADNEWLDYKMIDALNTGFKNNHFDYIISSNMIHHVPYPSKFFDEMYRILKPNGVLIIQEINCSFFMRLLLKTMRHEGYDYTIDVFDRNLICTDENDLWSANCAIPNLLFDDKIKFHLHFPNFTIIEYRFSEFFNFINSGGVISKTIYIPLPKIILKVIKHIDDFLVSMFPSIFALQRQIVLKKN